MEKTYKFNTSEFLEKIEGKNNIIEILRDYYSSKKNIWLDMDVGGGFSNIIDYHHKDIECQVGINAKNQEVTISFSGEDLEEGISDLEHHLKKYNLNFKFKDMDIVADILFER